MAMFSAQCFFLFFCLITCFVFQNTAWNKQLIWIIFLGWTNVVLLRFNLNTYNENCLLFFYHTTSGIIQLSMVCPSSILHRTLEGHWCLSSHLPLALPQSKVTLMPQAISHVHQLGFELVPKEVTVSPDLAIGWKIYRSRHWLKALSLGSTWVRDQVKTLRQDRTDGPSV